MATGEGNQCQSCSNPSLCPYIQIDYLLFKGQSFFYQFDS